MLEYEIEKKTYFTKINLNGVFEKEYIGDLESEIVNLLEDKDKKNFVINCSLLNYIGCVFLRICLILEKHTRVHRGKFVIEGLNEVSNQMLQKNDMTKSFLYSSDHIETDKIFANINN